LPPVTISTLSFNDIVAFSIDGSPDTCRDCVASGGEGGEWLASVALPTSPLWRDAAILLSTGPRSSHSLPRARRRDRLGSGEPRLGMGALLHLAEHVVEVEAGGLLALRVFPEGLQEFPDKGLRRHQQE